MLNKRAIKRVEIGQQIQVYFDYVSRKMMVFLAGGSPKHDSVILRNGDHLQVISDADYLLDSQLDTLEAAIYEGEDTDQVMGQKTPQDYRVRFPNHRSMSWKHLSELHNATITVIQLAEKPLCHADLVPKVTSIDQARGVY